MDRFIGRMLDDRYEILENIGTGGMAVVYKARCHRLNRLVAIKILKDENLEDAEFRRRFRAEGQAVGMLNHPNIVSVFDVVASKETDYIVMELVDGISLKQYMEKKGVLNWKETLHFATQIAKALEHAHSKGLVHRDIKPHNVMVLKNGAVRVTDFGIARVTSKASTMTKEALGSVHYISPEQAKGGRVDCRSDLYSLGVVMYEMITGRPPFDGESPVTVALQHIAGGATRPSVLNPNIPEGMEQIILKAMAHDAKDRYVNAAAMLADLDEVRKNPSIVFSPEHLAPPKKPAKQPTVPEGEKVQAKKKPAKAPKQDAAQKAAAKKQPKSREERALDRNRITTAVIVLCALAVMAAVVIFMSIWLSNSKQPEVKQVKVPSLVGMHYERLQDYEGVLIVPLDGQPAYSDEYGKGVIMQQRPEAGTYVDEGEKIFVVVSQGKKPETVLMPQLEDETERDAKLHLSGLGIKYEVKYESDDVVPQGSVIYTDPSAGTPLWDGAIVTLYVSSGKEIQKAVMPDLVNGPANTKEKAKQVMRQRGFTNVTWQERESNKPEGTILGQSVKEGTEVERSTHIVIEYAVPPAAKAKMPNLIGLDLQTAQNRMNILKFANVKWLEIDSSAPAGTVLSQSEEANSMVITSKEIIVEYSNGLLVDPVTIEYTIDGLVAKDEVQYLTLIYTADDGQQKYIHLELQPGQTSCTLELTGIGVQKYALYIDGVYKRTITVDFGTDKDE